ncbi:MAG TPA: LuxR C-terminal-related transcriptional regulator [Castellaniella sp.]|uniref:helix-turn-helix transcriptional regulator n=1 Tax=Castellaniella sp. TaxID=1955812 RepID=UPI002F07EE37
MPTVIVVEPNTLVRLGMLKLLETLGCALKSTGIDYAQLFNPPPGKPTNIDLMLLSVPESYQRTVELVAAAQQSYTPRHILLLSDTETLPYGLINLPPALAGYIPKHASQDVLKTSVRLVLAGGKCFPRPDSLHQAGTQDDTAPHSGVAPPRRRWYDRHDSSPPPRTEALNLEGAPDAPQRVAAAPHDPQPPSQSPANHPLPTDGQALTPEIISREADLLRLTPRQYEVLVLLAKGYPMKRISRELNISVATAKTHTEALYQRLSVNNSNSAVYAAISKGATLGWQGLPPVIQLVPAA